MGGAGGGSGGEGGSGGQPTGWPCPLKVDSPVGVDGGGTFSQRQPSLTYSSDNRLTVTLGMEWTMGDAAPSELRHTSFSPWGAWPTSPLGPSFRASFDAGRSFAVTSAPKNHFALVMSDGGKPTEPDGILFTADGTPGSGDVPPTEPVDDGVRVLFAAANANRFLIGVGESDGSAPVSIRSLTRTGTSTGLGTRWPIACGTNVSADAVAGGDGWWVATSGVAASFGAEDCTAFAGTAPNRVFVARVDVGLGIPNRTVDFEAVGGVRHVFLQAQPNKAPWLAWLDDAGAHVVMLDRTNGTALAGPFDVPADATAERIAAIPFLEGVLVARGSDGAVSYVGSNGMVASPITVPALGGATVWDGLAAPKNDAALLSLVVPGDPDRIQVARLRCETP